MIRAATINDCALLAEVHIGSWRQAYGKLIPQSYLDSLDVVSRAQRWREILAEGESEVLLHFAGEQLAGFASIGPSRDDDATETWGELAAFYYLRPYWGAGLSEQLLSSACTRLKERGFSPTMLWVLRENHRAISFYKKYGFEFDGAEKADQREGFTLNELRMRA